MMTTSRGARRKPAAPALIVSLALLLAGCQSTNQTSLALGDIAPDFALPSATGGDVSLAGLAEQNVLLYFSMADG